MEIRPMAMVDPREASRDRPRRFSARGEGRSRALRMLRTLCFACLALFLFATTARAAEILVSDDFDELPLGRSLELAYDPTGVVTAEEVAGGKLQFAPSTKDVPSFGYRGGAEWARFTVDDRRGAGVESLRLVNGYAQTDFFECFEVVDSVVSRSAEAGDQVPLARWPVRYREPTCPVATGSRTVLVRVGGDQSHQFPLTLLSRESFEERRRRDILVQSLFYGALLVMAAYNGLVAVATRSAAYAYYVGYLTSYGVFVLAVNGLLAFVEPRQLAVINATSPAAIAVGVFCSLRFADALFGFAAKSRWARGLRGLSVFALVGPAVASLFGYRWVLRTALVLMLPWAILLIGSGVHAARRGSRLGVLFLSAWGAFILATIANVGRVQGALPSNAFTVNSQQVGSVVEFLLLSFALAHRIKELQAEATSNAELAATNAAEAATNAEVARVATATALEAQHRTNAELQRLGKLKDDFLATTSHELRTPLHGMLGLTEGVLRSARGLDRASRDRLELVVASGRRLASLVNDVLDFSKLRHHELALREKSVELRGAVALSLAVIAPHAEPKALALASEVPAGLFVRADESRLQQILLNLLGNAVKFTDAGCVTVSARSGGGGRVHVSVHDTGVGIAAEAQPRIFESFEQADGSTAREHGGTGLGLAVTKQLVELHGGHIGVESAPGVGSTFFFDIAASEGPHTADAAASTAPARGGATREVPQPERLQAQDDLGAGFGSIGALHIAEEGGRHAAPHMAGARLLVADDDPVNVEVLKAQLEPEGHAVVVARDGADAVALLENSGPFDAVLLDVMMPKLTGPQAASEMRAQYPHGTLPILMLTAKSRPEDAVAGLRAGADDYGGEPVHRDELLARLDVHLESSRMTRALERLVRPRMVELAGRTRAGELRVGDGQGTRAVLARFSIEGLAAVAARHDERTFFERVARVVRRQIGRAHV